MQPPVRRNELPSWEDLYWKDPYSWSRGQAQALRDRDPDLLMSTAFPPRRSFPALAGHAARELP